MNKDKKLISEQKNIYFIFTSITYLQLYISLVIEFSKLGYNNIFIVNDNGKNNSNPISNSNNRKLLKKYYKKNNFTIKNRYEDFDDINKFYDYLKNIIGIVFLVDGDMYGIKGKYVDSSLIHYLNKDKTLKISLTEHLNFRITYNSYIDLVDYCIMQNKLLAEYFNTISDKNLYLGNTKFDNIMDRVDIYKKYKLSREKKYCLLFYPKKIYFKKKYKNINSLTDLNKIYKFLEKLGYSIIVKTRPKDNNIMANHKGILNVSSNYYPNESLELLKISELCVIFESSANYEALFMKVPCIDFRMKKISLSLKFNDLINDERIYIKFDNLKKLTYDDFIKKYNKLSKKNSSVFKKLRNKYVFHFKNSALNYIKFLKKNEYLK